MQWIMMIWKDYSAWVLLLGFFGLLWLLSSWLRNKQYAQSKQISEYDLPPQTQHNEDDNGKSAMLVIDLVIMAVLFAVISVMFPMRGFMMHIPLINIAGIVFCYYFVIKPMFLKK